MTKLYLIICDHGCQSYPSTKANCEEALALHKKLEINHKAKIEVFE